jgi:hypothetical protein
MQENSCLKLPQISNQLWCLKNEHLNVDYNFDHQMSLSKQLFTFLKACCSINCAQSSPGKLNHCNYSRQSGKTTTLLVWNRGNLILVWLNYCNIVRLFVSFCSGLYTTKTTLECLTMIKMNGAKVLDGFSFIGKFQ